MITGDQRVAMCNRIQEEFDDGTVEGWERVQKWWRTPNQLLGGAIPQELKDAGPDGEDELHRLVMCGKLP